MKFLALVRLGTLLKNLFVLFSQNALELLFNFSVCFLSKVVLTFANILLNSFD